jgi:hypothetical protein
MTSEAKPDGHPTCVTETRPLIEHASFDVAQEPMLTVASIDSRFFGVLHGPVSGAEILVFEQRES